MILVDTNVLLRRIQTAHPQYAAARAALTALRQQGETLCITPQNLVEFWSVATRPREVNGLGMAPTEVDREVGALEQLFQLLPETPQIYHEWRRLVMAHSVSGRQVHDARLAAVMLAHRVSNILTFNVDDFQRYGGITTVDPTSMAAT